MRPLPSRAVEVFGVIRQADEHELEVWQIAVRARLPHRQVSVATRDLCRHGLVCRRYVGRRALFSIHHPKGQQ